MAKDKLKQTIKNYYTAMNGGWEKGDYQMLSWLEELRDLRKILRKKGPQGNEAFEDLDEAIDWAKEEWAATGETGAKQRLFWLKQLKKARKRVGVN